MPTETHEDQPERPQKDPELVALGDQLRRLRLAEHLTQEALSERAGLHWTYVSQVECASRNPSYKSLRKLAGGLGVEPSQIMPKHH